MSTIAFRMSLATIDAHYFEGAPARTFCAKCGSLLNHNYVPDQLVIHSGSIPAIGVTYDGRAICSGDMKRHMTRLCLDLDFHRVNVELDLYHFRVRPVVKFDAERRRTRFIGPCGSCGQFEEVIGSQPVFLVGISAPLLTGIYRTDLEFGSGRNKSPELLAGLHTKAELQKVKFGGCKFMPIDG